MNNHIRHPLFTGIVFIVLLVGSCRAAPTSPIIKNPTNTPVIPTQSPGTSSPTTLLAIPPQPLWSFRTEKAIWSSPAVSDGIVYIGSDDGNLYAIEAQAGSLLWKFSTRGIIRSQPAFFEGLVYVTSDDGYLYAIKVHDGSQAWGTDIGNALPSDVRERLGTNTSPTGWDYKQSSPIVADERVYIGSLDHNVYALEANTGQTIWRYKTGGKVRATPTINQGVLYVGSWDTYFYALDARTGDLLWKKPLRGEVQSTAVVENNMVFTASRKASVVALDAQSGDRIWEFDYGTNMWVESSPVLNDGKIFIGSAGSKWIVGLDAQTGKLITSYTSRTYFMGTPAFLEDTLLITGATFRKEGEGGLFIFTLTDGKFGVVSQPGTSFPITTTLETEGNWDGAISSPLVQNGVVYFGGLDGILYALLLRE